MTKFYVKSGAEELRRIGVKVTTESGKQYATIGDAEELQRVDGAGLMVDFDFDEDMPYIGEKKEA